MVTFFPSFFRKFFSESQKSQKEARSVSVLSFPSTSFSTFTVSDSRLASSGNW